MKQPISLIVFLAVLYVNIANAQNYFKKIIPNLACSRAIQTADHGYVITGESDSLSYCKLDSSGLPSWAKFIPGFNILNVLETTDGSLFLCGIEVFSGYKRGVIVKSQSNGEIIWAKTYGLPFSIQPSNGSSEIIESGDGNLILLWIAQGGWEKSDVFISKISTNGNVIWSKRYNDYKGVHAKIINTQSGGFLFCAAHSHNDTFPDGSMVTKISSEGDLLWSKIIDNMNSANSIVEIEDSSFIIVGDRLIRMSSSGDLIWSKDFPQYGRDIARADVDNYLVISNRGWLLSSILNKIDLNGNIVFTNYFNDVPFPLFNIAPANNDGAILSGYYPEPNSKSSVGYLVKVNCGGFVGECNNPFENNQLTDILVTVRDKVVSIEDAPIQLDSIISWNNATYIDTTICFCENTIADYSYENLSDSVVLFTNTSDCAQSYHWSFGDNEFSDSLNPVHVYTSEGEFQVCLEVFDGCYQFDSMCQTITIDFPVSDNIDGSDNKTFIYPNPFYESIYFKTENSGLKEFMILDLYGKEIVTLASSDNLVEWGGKDKLGNVINSGIYILLIKESDILLEYGIIIKVTNH